MAKANFKKRVWIYFFLPSFAAALLPQLLTIEKSGIVARTFAGVFRSVLSLIV
jgi:hypothetical protein